MSEEPRIQYESVIRRAGIVVRSVITLYCSVGEDALGAAERNKSGAKLCALERKVGIRSDLDSAELVDIYAIALGTFRVIAL